MTDRIKGRLAAALAAGLLASAWTQGAAAQSDFVEYYYNAGVDTHFYYSPSSVVRAVVGDGVLVRWTDNRPKGAQNLIFLVLVGCNDRTSKMLSVDRVDAATGAYIATVDLREDSETQTAEPGTMGGYLVDRVC